MPDFVDMQGGGRYSRRGFGGGGGGIDYGGFDFGAEMAAVAPQQITIDFDKEKYYQSIVAPAEAARRDATTEAIQTARATAAMVGRPPGDIEAEILAGSVRQAGAVSAEAAKVAEEKALAVSMTEEQLEAQDLARRTQVAGAILNMKVGTANLRVQMANEYSMLRTKLDSERQMLHDRLGFERGEAESNRRAAYEIEMFKVKSGMAMVKYREDSANLRAQAGFAQSERESLRLQAYKMTYLDRWSKLQGMSVILDWADRKGRMAAAFGAKPEEGLGGWDVSSRMIEEPTGYDIEGAPYQPI